MSYLFIYHELLLEREGLRYFHFINPCLIERVWWYSRKIIYIDVF